MISQIFRQSVIALFALSTLLADPSRAAAGDSDGPQYYELRIYATKSDPQRQRVNDYWQNAAIPAYNRMGIRPIGVFSELEDSATNRIYIVIPCDSVEIFAAIPATLANDAAYQKAASEFLEASKSNPAYDHFESSLLVAFAGMKHLAVPPPEKRPNVFELRNYLSPSEGKGLNKIQMFESGEITTMQEVGLAPIFYGRTVAGSHMPCLFYMTSGENLEEHKKHWQAFNDSAVWKKLIADPYYKDNMNGAVSIILKRTPASQL